MFTHLEEESGWVGTPRLPLLLYLLARLKLSTAAWFV